MTIALWNYPNLVAIAPWHDEYRRLRNKGYAAHEAWRAAHVLEAFRVAEEADLVKLETECEFDYYDDSYVDTWGLSPARVKRIKTGLAERIEREGHWIVVTYARAHTSDEWSAVDSVGGFIGQDYLDSGYDTDLRQASLTRLEELRQEAANVLAERATYAAG